MSGRKGGKTLSPFSYVLRNLSAEGTGLSMDATVVVGRVRQVVVMHRMMGVLRKWEIVITQTGRK